MRAMIKITDNILNSAQSDSRRNPPNGELDRENVNAKRQKARHRASVACASCRERRIRCVVPSGESECEQCQRLETRCIIKNDDERRRPISRAYMSTLTDRVALLESLLKEVGTEPPPVKYPPKTTRGSLYPDGADSPIPSIARESSQQQYPSTGSEGYGPKISRDEEVNDSKNTSVVDVEGQLESSDHDSSVGTPIDDKKNGLVSRLLSTRGHLSFDQLSGRMRFYGGTVNCHIFVDPDVNYAKSVHKNDEQVRRAEKCIGSLTIETHDYLMTLFWSHYNAVLHVVHEEAFNEDRKQGRTQFYSGFLHICILAMGYRFADEARSDIEVLTLPNRESTLHREAKCMLDLELEHPGGIPSIAALLILGDSEVGVGRDNTGWMYAGMAMRMCYDIGLHLDGRQAGLPQRDTDIQRMTLWACVVYDRYWSLFLGRPLAMKSTDLEIYSLSSQFQRLGTCMPAGAEKSVNTKIYEALIDLMEIAGKIVEHAELRGDHQASVNLDQQACLRMAALDRDLRAWTTRLPPALRYTEDNRTNAPLSFFLLHQQYHAVLILLHRPFARYGDVNGPDGQETSALCAHFAQASRAICTKSAISIARIFWQHRQRFDGKKLFCTAMQHAGTAATALIAALANTPDSTDRNNNMQYLEVLHAALQDMSYAYQPAERMAQVLNAVMIELRGGPISPKPASTPARRGSSTIEAERGPMKRRQVGWTQHEQESMAPPPPPDTSGNLNEFDSARQFGTSQFNMPNPHTDLQPWTNMCPSGGLPAQQDVMATPAEASTTGAAGTQQEWLNGVGNGFSLDPSTSNIPKDNINSLDFLYMPSEDGWNQWHAASGPNAITDLDGFPSWARDRPA